MTSQPSEFSLVVRGLRLSGLSWGAPESKPMIALHGWLDNAESFSELAPLIKDRRVIALDFPGHGWSEHRLEGAPYYNTEYALDTLHLIQQLGDDPVDLIGHSMGAGVACCVAAGLPKAVDKLVLLDGVGPWPGDEKATATRLNTSFQQNLGAPAQIAKYSSIDDLIARRKTATSYLAHEQIEKIVRRNSVESIEGWSWRTDPRLKSSSLMMFTESEVEDILSHINSQVLYVAALGGIMDGVPYADSRLEKITDITKFSIAGHHHFHMDGAVDSIADHVNQFLSAPLPA